MEELKVEKRETENTKVAPVQQQDEYTFVFNKPLDWEGQTYKEIDLSGLLDMKARDMINVQRTMERTGSVSVMPELTLEYALMFAAKATDMPVEFFQDLPPNDAIRLKNYIQAFLNGQG